MAEGVLVCGPAGVEHAAHAAGRLRVVHLVDEVRMRVVYACMAGAEF